MHPDLITLPNGFGIKTYGFCMMVGFLSAVWMSMRRAERVKADADVVLDLGLLSLLFGVGGARAFYVIHYWQTQFADRPNKLIAVIDITEGGLEFLGGFLGAFFAITIYSLIKKISMRMYMDILAPGVMWGLAFGRLGCFFNGCCFGGLCEVEHTHEAKYTWAVQFPFASPAQYREWEERQVTVPAELITTSPQRLMPGIIPGRDLSMSPERRDGPLRQYTDAVEAYRTAKEEDPQSGATEQAKGAVEKARKAWDEHQNKIGAILLAQQMPSRVNPKRNTSVSELADIAAAHRSLPVHPTQLYSSIHALILSGVLSAMFYVRKRHGVVIASIFLFYPIPRMLLESIRADNPGDVGGLTASQGISLIMLTGAIIAMIVLYKFLPERSPLAVPVEKKEES